MRKAETATAIILIALSVLSLTFRGQQAQTVTIDCAPGSVIQQTLPSGALQVRCAAFKPTPTPAPAPLAAIIVAPNGSATAPGTLAAPLSPVAALRKDSPAKPGDTVLLRGGTYRGAFVAELNGTPEKPIIIRNYPGERVVIDGAGFKDHTVTITGGSNVQLWGLEITNSAPDRVNGSPTCVSVQAPGVKLINNVLHDAGSGVFANQQAVDFEAYGNIIFNHGWQGSAPDRPHGHGIYLQNSTGTKRIVDNLIFNQYGWGIHAYGQEADLKGIQIEGNTVWGSGALARTQDGTVNNILIGGYKPADKITLLNNLLYFPLDLLGFNAQFHYLADNNGALTLTDNYIAGGSLGIEARSWQSITGKGNTVISKTYLVRLTPTAGGVVLWDSNSYVHLRDDPSHTPFRAGGDGWTFADWQRLKGYDKSANYRRVTKSTDIPNAVFVRPNKYEPGRAHITIFNWSRQTNVSVDLSKVLKVGERFEIFNVTNLSTAVLSGVFNGSAVSVPAQAEFAAFLVAKK